MTIPFEGPEIPMVVRTDDARFANLPDYPFTPNYFDVSNPCASERSNESIRYASVPERLRMHYVDEGPKEAPVVLMAHGEPAWSFLYRKMIPVLVDAGLRAIAIDHIGFGRSDKLTRPAHYSFARHVGWMRELVVGLDLRDITIVCQDWGGPIAMAVLAQEMDRFARVAAGNTMLHTGESELAGRLAWAAHGSGEGAATVENALLDWMLYTTRVPEFAASGSVAGTVVRGMAPDVVAAYDAPFPSEWHRAGMRQFPALIPVTRSDPGAEINRATWRALAGFDRPFLTIFSDGDPSTRGWEAIFRERIPGAKGQPHQVLERAGHFWQEDCGEEAARIIADWIGAS